MKTIWFKRKRYGWGWYPVGWKGWSVITAYLAVVGVGSFLFENEATRLSILLFVSTVFLVAISYLKGEAPKWQWGDGGVKAGFEKVEGDK